MRYTVKCGPTVAVINNTACLIRQVGQLVYYISAELKDLTSSAPNIALKSVNCLLLVGAAVTVLAVSTPDIHVSGQFNSIQDNFVREFVG